MSQEGHFRHADFFDFPETLCGSAYAGTDGLNGEDNR